MARYDHALMDEEIGKFGSKFGNPAHGHAAKHAARGKAGKSIKFPALYDHLRAKGHSKQKAAMISNGLWRKKKGKAPKSAIGLAGVAKGMPEGSQLYVPAPLGADSTKPHKSTCKCKTCKNKRMKEPVMDNIEKNTALRAARAAGSARKWLERLHARDLDGRFKDMPNMPDRDKRVRIKGMQDKDLADLGRQIANGELIDMQLENQVRQEIKIRRGKPFGGVEGTRPSKGRGPVAPDSNDPDMKAEPAGKRVQPGRVREAEVRRRAVAGGDETKASAVAEQKRRAGKVFDSANDGPIPAMDDLKPSDRGREARRKDLKDNAKKFREERVADTPEPDSIPSNAKEGSLQAGDVRNIPDNLLDIAMAGVKREKNKKFLMDEKERRAKDNVSTAGTPSVPKNEDPLIRANELRDEGRKKKNQAVQDMEINDDRSGMRHIDDLGKHLIQGRVGNKISGRSTGDYIPSEATKIKYMSNHYRDVNKMSRSEDGKFINVEFANGTKTQIPNLATVEWVIDPSKPNYKKQDRKLKPGGATDSPSKPKSKDKRERLNDILNESYRGGAGDVALINEDKSKKRDAQRELDQMDEAEAEASKKPSLASQPNPPRDISREKSDLQKPNSAERKADQNNATARNDADRSKAKNLSAVGEKGEAAVLRDRADKREAEFRPGRKENRLAAIQNKRKNVRDMSDAELDKDIKDMEENQDSDDKNDLFAARNERNKRANNKARDIDRAKQIEGQNRNTNNEAALKRARDKTKPPRVIGADNDPIAAMRQNRENAKTPSKSPIKNRREFEFRAQGGISNFEKYIDGLDVESGKIVYDADKLDSILLNFDKYRDASWRDYFKGGGNPRNKRGHSGSWGKLRKRLLAEQLDRRNNDEKKFLAGPAPREGRTLGDIPKNAWNGDIDNQIRLWKSDKIPTTADQRLAFKFFAGQNDKDGWENWYMLSSKSPKYLDTVTTAKLDRQLQYALAIKRDGYGGLRNSNYIENLQQALGGTKQPKLSKPSTPKPPSNPKSIKRATPSKPKSITRLSNEARAARRDQAVAIRPINSKRRYLSADDEGMKRRRQIGAMEGNQARNAAFVDDANAARKNLGSLVPDRKRVPWKTVDPNNELDTDDRKYLRSILGADANDEAYKAAIKYKKRNGQLPRNFFVVAEAMRLRDEEGVSIGTDRRIGAIRNQRAVAEQGRRDRLKVAEADRKLNIDIRNAAKGRALEQKNANWLQGMKEGPLGDAFNNILARNEGRKEFESPLFQNNIMHKLNDARRQYRGYDTDKLYKMIGEKRLAFNGEADPAKKIQLDIEIEAIRWRIRRNGPEQIGAEGVAFENAAIEQAGARIEAHKNAETVDVFRMFGDLRGNERFNDKLHEELRIRGFNDETIQAVRNQVAAGSRGEFAWDDAVGDRMDPNSRISNIEQALRTEVDPKVRAQMIRAQIKAEGIMFNQRLADRADVDGFWFVDIDNDFDDINAINAFLDYAVENGPDQMMVIPNNQAGQGFALAAHAKGIRVRRAEKGASFDKPGIKMLRDGIGNKNDGNWEYAALRQDPDYLNDAKQNINRIMDDTDFGGEEGFNGIFIHPGFRNSDADWDDPNRAKWLNAGNMREVVAEEARPESMGGRGQRDVVGTEIQGVVNVNMAGGIDLGSGYADVQIDTATPANGPNGFFRQDKKGPYPHAIVNGSPAADHLNAGGSMSDAPGDGLFDYIFQQVGWQDGGYGVNPGNEGQRAFGGVPLYASTNPQRFKILSKSEANNISQIHFVVEYDKDGNEIAWKVFKGSTGLFNFDIENEVIVSKLFRSAGFTNYPVTEFARDKNHKGPRWMAMDHAMVAAYGIKPSEFLKPGGKPLEMKDGYTMTFGSDVSPEMMRRLTKEDKDSYALMTMIDLFSGNADRHEKNWSVVTLPDGSVRMALYDTGAAWGDGAAIRRGEHRLERNGQLHAQRLLEMYENNPTDLKRVFEKQLDQMRSKMDFDIFDELREGASPKFIEYLNMVEKSMRGSVKKDAGYYLDIILEQARR